MTKQIDHNMPSITPDKDQVEAFKNTRTYSSIPPSSSDTYSTNSRAQVKQEQKTASSSMLSKFSTLLIYVLISCAAYWVYQQNIKTNAKCHQYLQRFSIFSFQLFEICLFVTCDEGQVYRPCRLRYHPRNYRSRIEHRVDPFCK